MILVFCSFIYAATSPQFPYPMGINPLSATNGYNGTNTNLNLTDVIGRGSGNQTNLTVANLTNYVSIIPCPGFSSIGSTCFNFTGRQSGWFFPSNYFAGKTAFTFSVWANLSGNGSQLGYAEIIGNRNTANRDMELQLVYDGDPSYPNGSQMTINSGKYQITKQTNTLFYNHTSFHHIVWRFNGTAHSFWWDGVQRDVNTSQGVLGAFGGNLYLGSEGSRSLAYTFNGSMTDLLVWNNTALTDSQIRQLWAGNWTYNPYLSNNSYSSYSINFTTDGGQSCGYNLSGNWTLCGPTNSTTPTFRAIPLSSTATFRLYAYNGTYFNYTTLSQIPYNYSNCTYSGVEITCTYPVNLSAGINQMIITGHDGTSEQNSIGENYAGYFNISINCGGITNVVLYMDGYALSQKYELGTTASLNINTNCTGNNAQKVCLDSDYYGVNYTCSYTTPFLVNYTQLFLLYTKFADGNTTETLSNNSFSIFNISSQTGKTLYISFNINGTAGAPYDIEFDVGNKKSVDVIYPMFMNKTVCYTDRFTNNLTTENMTFVVGGINIRYLNYSTNNLNVTNVTISLSGFASNSNSTFSYTELFGTNISNISSYVNASLPSYPWDDINGTDTLGHWGGTYAYTPSSYPNGYIYGYLNVPTITSIYPCVPQSGNQHSNFYSQALNLQNDTFAYFNVLLTWAYSSASSSCGACGIGEYAQAGIRDKTTSVNYEMDAASYGHNVGDIVTIQNSNGYLNWYTGTTYKGQVPMVSGHLYEIYTYYGYSYYDSGLNAGGAHAYCGASSSANVYPVNISGLTLPYTGNSLLFNISGNASMTTKLLWNSTANITRARITTYKASSTGGNEYLALANNNSNDSWVDATSGNFVVFSKPGNLLYARINISGTSSTSPFIISYFTVDTFTGTVSNVKVDAGNDGVVDYSFNGIMNETNSPVNISLPSAAISSYIFSNCNGTTCLVPISFSSDTAGLLQYSALYASQDNTVNAPVTLFNTTSPKNITVNVTWQTNIANISIYNLKEYYYGDGIVNLTAHINKSTTSQLIYWKYSPFNITFPYGIYYWELFPTSRAQTNIQPYGQNATASIFNVSSTEASHNGMDVYAKYNSTINTCVLNMWFTGYNYSVGARTNTTINLTTSAQEISINMTSYNSTSTWTYTDINCTTGSIIFPYFCFFSICHDCVRTFDWNDTCTQFR